MGDYTIYSDGIWERMLEKYPELKEKAVQCGVENNPQKAQELRGKYKSYEERKLLTQTERNLAMTLGNVEFKEIGFLRQVVITGSLHHANGAGDYTMASFELILADFEESFQDWYKEIRKRNISENTSFEQFYEVFLDVIKLKLDYKVPYTKLFIHKLLENSAMPKEDSLEIKQYFLKENPEILPEIKCELIE